MKRLLLTIIVFTIVLLAVFSYLKNQGSKETHESNVGRTNMGAKIASPVIKSDTLAGTGNDPLAKMGITPDMTQAQREEKFKQWYMVEAAKLVPEQKPIALFGMVVDEHKQPVAEASIHFIMSTTTSADGVAHMDTKSAKDGSFSLTGITGSGVSVYVSKKGYYLPKSGNRIDFDTTGNGSTRENPVIFHLLKKGPGAKLITSQHGVYPNIDLSAPQDGTPVYVDLLSQKIASSGQIEVSAVKPPKTDYRGPKAWSFSMSIPNGGFVEQNDEFPFEAPQSGYQQSVTFDFRPGQTNWTDTINKHYYIKFGSPPKYGRIDIQTGMYQGIRLNYAINPDGSTNLEPQ